MTAIDLILPFYLENVVTDNQADPIIPEQVLVDLTDFDECEIDASLLIFSKEGESINFEFINHTEANRNFQAIHRKKTWVINAIQRRKNEEDIINN